MVEVRSENQYLHRDGSTGGRFPNASVGDYQWRCLNHCDFVALTIGDV